jgi:hypothetical protein
MRIDDFVADSRALDADAFRLRHGDRFLVHEGPLEPGRRVVHPQSTVDAKAAPVSEGSPPKPDLLVFPLRQMGRSAFPRMITVGRTKNNDVVLPDVMISKFHAFFKEENGQLVCQDAESRNGSFVDGKRAPSTRRGKGLKVEPGAVVKFGPLEFEFLSAANLWDLARRQPL